MDEEGDHLRQRQERHRRNEPKSGNLLLDLAAVLDRPVQSQAGSREPEHQGERRGRGPAVSVEDDLAARELLGDPVEKGGSGLSPSDTASDPRRQPVPACRPVSIEPAQIRDRSGDHLCNLGVPDTDAFAVRWHLEGRRRTNGRSPEGRSGRPGCRDHSLGAAPSKSGWA